jgi:hypothetical protein
MLHVSAATGGIAERTRVIVLAVYLESVLLILTLRVFPICPWRFGCLVASLAFLLAFAWFTLFCV